MVFDWVKVGEDFDIGGVVVIVYGICLIWIRCGRMGGVVDGVKL